MARYVSGSTIRRSRQQSPYRRAQKIHLIFGVSGCVGTAVIEVNLDWESFLCLRTSILGKWCTNMLQIFSKSLEVRSIMVNPISDARIKNFQAESWIVHLVTSQWTTPWFSKIGGLPNYVNRYKLLLKVGKKHVEIHSAVTMLESYNSWKIWSCPKSRPKILVSLWDAWKEFIPQKKSSSCKRSIPRCYWRGCINL